MGDLFDDCLDLESKHISEGHEQGRRYRVLCRSPPDAEHFRTKGLTSNGKNVLQGW